MHEACSVPWPRSRPISTLTLYVLLARAVDRARLEFGCALPLRDHAHLTASTVVALDSGGYKSRTHQLRLRTLTNQLGCFD